MQCRNAVCDAQLSPGFGWDLGGAGLEMEHLGMVFEGMSQNTHHSVRGMFHLPHPLHGADLAISGFLGHGLDIIWKN